MRKAGSRGGQAWTAGSQGSPRVGRVTTKPATSMDESQPHDRHDHLHRRSDAPLRGRIAGVEGFNDPESYATAGWDAKIGWNAVTQRIGHADVAFTIRRFVQSDLDTDHRSRQRSVS